MGDQDNVRLSEDLFSDAKLDIARLLPEGLDFALHNRMRRKNNMPPLRYDPFEDLEYFATSKLLLEEFPKQLPLLKARIDEVDRKYQSILEQWRHAAD